MDSIKSGGVWCRESPPDGDNATRSRTAREPAKSEDDEDDAIVRRSRRLSVFEVGYHIGAVAIRTYPFGIDSQCTQEGLLSIL